MAGLLRPRRSRFTHVEMLHEPGISDVDDGRWARRLVRCTRCGETRAVWIGTDFAAITDRCRPSVRHEVLR